MRSSQVEAVERAGAIRRGLRVTIEVGPVTTAPPPPGSTSTARRSTLTRSAPAYRPVRDRKRKQAERSRSALTRSDMKPSSAFSSFTALLSTASSAPEQGEHEAGPPYPRENGLQAAKAGQQGRAEDDDHLLAAVAVLVPQRREVGLRGTPGRPPGRRSVMSSASSG